MENAQRTAGAEASAPASAGARRARYVALRGPGPSMLLRFHPNVTVLYGFEPGLVEWLAAAMAAGASGTVDGFAELDGERVPLADVPASLFELGPCPIVPHDALSGDLEHLGRGTAPDIATEEQAIVAAIRAVRAQTEALGARVGHLDEEIAAAEQHLAALHASRPPARRSVARDHSEDAAQLRGLLDALDAANQLPKVASPAAAALARALDTIDHAARRNRPRAEVEEELRKWELVTAEARARLAERRATAPRIAPADLAEASRLREAARAAAERGNRRFRRRAPDDHSDHEQELQALLERLGARSYEDLMLLGTGLGSTDSDLAIREATNVVGAAERRCAELRTELTEPGLPELGQERAELIERARQLLGYEPGTDPAAALRALRVEPPEVVQAQGALVARLHELGAQVTDAASIADAAVELIEQWQHVRDEQEHARAEQRRHDDEIKTAEQTVRDARTKRTRLVRQIDRYETEIEDLEFDRRRLRERPLPAAIGVARITPAIVDRAVTAMLHNAGAERSPLPIVIDDPFAALPPELRRVALRSLARQSDGAQLVLVTADAGAVHWARSANDPSAAAWTADDARGVYASRSKSG
jgi:hypothetical protein